MVRSEKSSGRGPGPVEAAHPVQDLAGALALRSAFDEGLEGQHLAGAGFHFEGSVAYEMQAVTGPIMHCAVR